MMTTSQIVQRLWNYCNLLRDEGLSYGDYVEQLTYLLFLKMADERTKEPYEEPSRIPAGLDWQSLKDLKGEALEEHYRDILKELGNQQGMLGIIFKKAINKIQDPAKLRRLIVDLIDPYDWLSVEIDVKGEAYEGLLEKNAEDVKSGAGQYFTSRALIRAIVEVMRPEPGMRICDPACGTGGFLLVAHDFIAKTYDLRRREAEALQKSSFYGYEIVDSTARLCVMNLFLHGIGDDSGNVSPVTVGDSLLKPVDEPFDMILSNPPFGRKSSLTFVNTDGEQDKNDMIVTRNDFWATTSNKQLNFVQHIVSSLTPYGRAAVVVPDNVLFEGGAGEKIRSNLLRQCNVHTLLRLPTGIFYAQGVKANVLFFEKRPGSEEAQTKELWIYDLRTNQNFTLRGNPLKYPHLEDFVRCYNPENRHRRRETERFRKYRYDDLVKRDKLNLDIFWLKDESLESAENLPAPRILAKSILEDLEAALEQFRAIAGDVGGGDEEDGGE